MHYAIIPCVMLSFSSFSIYHFKIQMYINDIFMRNALHVPLRWLGHVLTSR